MRKAYREYGFSLLAGAVYLLLHEGTHVLQALAHGIFQGFHFNALGVEVLITEPLTIGGWQLACFSGLSSVVTVGVGYLLTALMPSIFTLNSRFAKSCLYYITVVFLLLDPLYISLFSFFVGGDINGIAVGLNLPYMPIRIFFALPLALNLLLVIKKIYPQYTQNYIKA